MASHTSGIIFFGFAAVFSCLELLEIQASQSNFTWLAAAAFVAVFTAFGLTLLLLFSYVRSLGANAARGDAGRRFLGRLAVATLLAAMAALLAGAAMCLVASGHLVGADDDVGWQHRKK